MEHLAAIAHPSTFVCPDCSEITVKTLQSALTEAAEAAMGAAVHTLQEQGFLLDVLVAAHRNAGEHAEAARFESIRQTVVTQTTMLRAQTGMQTDTF